MLLRKHDKIRIDANANHKGVTAMTQAMAPFALHPRSLRKGDRTMRRISILLVILTLGGCGTFGFSEPPVYVVFFPDHQTALTADGANIVRHVAADARLKGMEMVQVTGPSTKITRGYDPSLAEPRIEAVEVALVADGVSKDRLARTSLTTTDVNVKADPSGAQRVEIRLVDRPASASAR